MFVFFIIRDKNNMEYKNSWNQLVTYIYLDFLIETISTFLALPMKIIWSTVILNLSEF